MTNANKAKGDRYEREIESFCREAGFADAQRTRAGRREDQGDIHLAFAGPAPSVVIQTKDVVQVDWRGWLTELTEQTSQAGADHGVLVVKRRGRGATKPLHLAVMPFDAMLQLLKAAGYGSEDT